MGLRECPNCHRIVETRVLPNGFGQVELNGILAKKRRVICRVEDGGCGYEFDTGEVPMEILIRLLGNEDPNAGDHGDQ